MRKSPAVAAIVLIALILGGAAPLMLRAQAGGAARPIAATDDLPHRTTRAFAPFVRALILRRMNTAQQIFKVRRPVMTALEQPEVVRILGRFQKPDRLDLNLVGGRMLGQNIGILLFTIANEEGPVYFKIYYYGVTDQIYVDRIDISDDWDDLEAAAASVETLQTPITVSLSGADDTGGK
jgi:hypothetical protein